MSFGGTLKIGLLSGAFLVAILALYSPGRPPFLIGLVLLAALIELGLSQFWHHPEVGDNPAGYGQTKWRENRLEEKHHADRK